MPDEKNHPERPHCKPDAKSESLGGEVLDGEPGQDDHHRDEEAGNEVSAVGHKGEFLVFSPQDAL